MRFNDFLTKIFSVTRRHLLASLFVAIAVCAGPWVSAARAMVQQTSLTAADAFNQDYFGCTMALSSNGNTALIGAIGGGMAYNQGAAYIFARTNGVWGQQAELIASDGAAADRLGDAVALSGDGNTAIVGAGEDDNARGAAYVFVRVNGIWTQQQKLTASDGAELDGFGTSLALSSDGNTALVGAYYDDSIGSAYVFKRNGTSWTQQAKITASDAAAYDAFGLFVSLSGDGNIALISATGQTVGANADQGAAYIFKWNGASWVQQKLTASDGAANDGFGSTLAISSDGGTAVVGSKKKTVGANADQGAAYIFKWNGASWVQQKLTASDGAAGDLFGNGVSLSSDGVSVMISATGRNTKQGAAYSFIWNGSSWAQQQILTASDGAANDQLGWPGLTLSGDGTTLLFGASNKNSAQGVVYAFVSEFNINIISNAGGTVSCTPNPVQAHMDSLCTMTPANNFSSGDYNYISEVQVAPVIPIWSSIDPTSKYTFSNVVCDHNINVAFAPTNIWLYRKNMFPVSWEWLSTEDTIAGALLHILLTYFDTNTVRIPTGAYAESGGVLCYEAIDVTFSGGWTSETARDASSPMSTVAGPFTIRNSCSLIMDGITIE